jgi:hypothetical protein
MYKSVSSAKGGYGGGNMGKWLAWHEHGEYGGGHGGLMSMGMCIHAWGGHVVMSVSGTTSQDGTCAS